MSDRKNLSAVKRALLEKRLRRGETRIREAEATIPRRGSRGPAPLSFAQERLWLVDRFEPGAPAYDLPGCLDLRGKLDVVALRRAWRGLVERHEALRTVFPEDRDGRPVQRVEPPVWVELPVVDLRRLPEGRREAEAARLEASLARFRFPLARGPLVRAVLLRRSLDCHALVLNLHHIVADGLSLEILMGDLAALYRGAVTGEGAKLPPLKIQYSDFAVWQRQWLEGEVSDTQLTAHRRRLEGVPFHLELPTDRPRSTLGLRSGRILRRRWPRRKVDELTRGAQTGKVTPFMALLTVYGALLSRQTGQEDFVVGAPVANRRRPELEPVIGFFVNTLLLRIDLRGEPSYRQALARVRQDAVDAFSHQDLPYERLAEALRPGERRSPRPLFQTTLAFFDRSLPELSLPGVTARPRPIDNGTAKFDLAVTLEMGTDELEVTWEYDAELFDATRMERSMDQFGRLLFRVARSPDRPLARWDLLSTAERHQVLVEWNATGSAPPSTPGRTIPEVFLHQARQRPEATALRFEGGAWSYRDLEGRAGRVARELQRAGVGPDDLVAVVADRTPEMVAALLGISWAGAAYVALDPEHPKQRLLAVLDDAFDATRPRILWVRHERLDAWRRIVEALAETRRPEVWSLAPSEDVERGAAPGEIPPVLGRDHLAYLAYTSGSTGRPKGVAVPHGAVLRLVRSSGPGAYADFGPDRTGLLLAPVSFDASTFEIWGPLLHGGCLAIAPAGRLSLQALARVLEHWQVDTLWLTAGLFHRMVEDVPEGLAPVRQLLAGGDVLSPSHVRQALETVPGLLLINGYGPTENTTFTCCHRMYGPSDVGSPVPIGRPIAETRVYVLDRRRQPAPLGVTGELYVAGRGLARGYRGRPGRTAAVFVPAPAPEVSGERLYRTGDLARFRVDGSLDFLGRADRQVKIRGFRIEPAEVEEVLRAHVRVRDAVVVAHRPASGETFLAAYVVTEDSTEDLETWESDLHRHLAQHLPEAFRPTSLTALESLPLTAQGKVDRSALPEPASRIEGDPRRRGGLPETLTEELLAEIWSEALGIDDVRREDDFFALGGHSLLATRVISRIRTVFGVELPLGRIFEAPTLEALARAVDVGHSDTPSLPSLLHHAKSSSATSSPLSYAQERLWLVDQLRPGDPAYNIPLALEWEDRRGRWTMSQALQEVERRHHVLRTAYRSTADGPRQEVHPPRRARPPVVDLTALSVPTARRRARALRTAYGLRPFDLAQGPVWRHRWLWLENGRSQLLLSVHHIAADGASFQVLFEELRELRKAWRSGRPSPLPELPLQVADFARWQRHWLTGPRLDQELEHWRGRLGELPETAGELPLDRPRPRRPSGRGGCVELRVSPEITNALRRRAREDRGTLFMILLAVFDVFLARHTGRRQVVVGSPLASRMHPEIRALIGFFVDFLPLGTDLSGDPSLKEVFNRVRTTALEAYAHPHLPLERLMEVLDIEADTSRNGLFQVAFALQNAPDEGRTESAMQARRVDTPHPTAKLDLTWTAREAANGGLATEIEYSEDLFDRVTIRRFGQRLEGLLEAWTKAQETLPWSALPSLTPSERHQVLDDWSRGAHPSPEVLPSLPRQIRARAVESPDTIAIQWGDRVLSYGALMRRADGLAARLRNRGIGPESIVALHGARNPERIVAMLAVGTAGAAYVPLDPAYPSERLRLLVEDSRASLVLLDATSPDTFSARDVPTLRIAGMEEIGDGAEVEPEPFPEQLAYVVYTSGSTGRPKGVAVNHGGLSGLTAWHHRAFAPGSGHRISHLAGLGFDASVWEVWPCLAAGATLVLPTEDSVRTRPEELRDWLLTKGITQAFVPTPVTEALLELSWPPRGSLERLLTGGDRLRRVAPRHGAFRLVNNYGPSESTVVTTSGPVREDVGVPDLGRPVDPVRVYLLDPWDGRPVPPGVVGELVVAGKSLARGYLHRPAWTAERFVPDPWSPTPGGRLYRTGDLGRHLPDGRIEFRGRRDHQVQVRGVRIEPAEIEAVLEELPHVERAVVLARTRGTETTLVAYVVPGEGESLGAISALREALRRRLPEPWIPGVFMVLDELPLTPHGKVDRRSLPAPQVSEETGGPPRTPREAQICALWSRVLEVPSVGRLDNFFTLGGHSLKAAQVTSKLRGELGLDLSVEDLFTWPTPAALAQRAARIPALKTLQPEISRGRTEYQAPLSFGQERLWFLDRLDPGTTSLHIPTGARLEGNLTTSALEQSLGESLRRHDVLRSRFEDGDGPGPVTRIGPPQRARLPRIDLSELVPSCREDVATRLFDALAARSFDLRRGPLSRWVLVRETPDVHRLFLSIHHIVADGWSLGLLWQGVAEHYEAFVEGRPSGRDDLPIQYGDFAAWQRRRLEGEDLDRQLDYWRQRLGGETRPLDLPSDRPRPPRQTYRGDSRLSHLCGATVEALTELGRQEGATRFMVLLAAFQLLLARWSGRSHVLVGTPAAGRGRPEIDSLVGFFLHTLVLGLDVGDDPPFRELVRRTRDEALGAYAHQEVPFEKILETVQPDRDPSRTPLFQVFFNMLELPEPELRLPDLRWVSQVPGDAPAKFDLTLYLRPDGKGLVLDWVYNADLFDAERIEELAVQFHRLLEKVAACPEARGSQYRLDTLRGLDRLPDPTRKLSRVWPGPVDGLVEDRARTAPDRTAVVDGESHLSYGQLIRNVDRLSRELRSRGIGRGDVVAVYAAREAALVISLLAILRAGGAFLILDPQHPSARAELCFRLSGARGILRLPSAGFLPSSLEEAATACGAFVLNPTTLATEFPAEPRRTPEGRSRRSPVGAEDAAYVAFTSGTTGTPKGIVGRHGSFTHFTPWAVETFQLTPEDRYSVLSGLTHDPLHRDVLTPLQTGGTVVLPTPEERMLPDRLVGWLRREQVTVAHLTPALCRLLTGARDLDEIDLATLRRCFFVGEALRESDVGCLRALAPKCEYWNSYGSTESQRALSYFRVDRADPGSARALPLGRGYDAVQLLVLTRSGEPAGLVEAGELYLRSPFLARGYLNDPAGTASRFLPAAGGERIYRTGDLGRYRLDGEVEFLGRLDRQVQIRGFRVEPAEVETQLGRCPEVRDAVVAVHSGAGDSPGEAEPRLVAYVVAPATSLEGLRRRLSERLPSHMIPTAFVCLDSVPLTPNGKIDWRALPEPSGEMEATGEPPRSALEQRLADLWSELLEAGDVSREADFFALGGHSLLAVRLVSRLRETDGLEVPVRMLFEAPTPARLARVIEELRDRERKEPTESTALRPRPRSSQAPLSFAQKRLWFLERFRPGNAAYHLPVSFDLDGPVSGSRLRSVLAEISRRHEVLRSRFPTVDGEPVQWIGVQVPAPRWLDVSGLDAEDRRREIERGLRAGAQQGFDLASDVPLRWWLIRQGDRGHVLLGVVHHIAADGWSLGVMSRELAALYPSYAAGRPSPLREPELQYGDFAVWQIERSKRGMAWADDLEWWRNHLDGIPAGLELPTDRPRPAHQSFRGTSLPMRMSASRHEALAEMCRAAGATPFMGLLTMFATLLARWSRQATVVVGAPVAGRTRRALEDLVGLFVNTLPLRIDLDDRDTWKSLLRRVREETLEATQRQEVPFERLVDALKLERDPSRPPIFQALLSLQNVPPGARRVSGLRLTQRDLQAPGAKLDIALSWSPQEDGSLVGRLEYDTALFDLTTVERFARRHDRLLSAVLDAPDRGLHELSPTSAAETAQILWEWNDTARMLDPTATAVVAFEEQVRREPDRVALWWRGDAWSWRELDRRSHALARALRRRGAGPETRVAVLLERGPELVAALWGILRAGAAYVPVDPSYPPSRVRYVLEDARVLIAVTDPSRAADLPESLPWISSTLEPGLSASEVEIPPPGAHEAAYVIYTSGSTGRPKGVVVAHYQLTHFLLAMDHLLGRTQGTWLAGTSVSFDISVVELLWTLTRGVPVVLSREGPVAELGLRQAVEEFGVRNYQCTPSRARMHLLDAEERRAAGRLDLWLVGGEALPSGLAERILEVGVRKLVNVYGPTETTVWSSSQQIVPKESRISIGRPLSNTEMYVVDPSGRPTPLGVPGELYIGGAGVTRGYWRRPALTAERFVPDDFSRRPGKRLYRTGDLARFLSGGRLEFLGRVDHQVKIRGHRIELGEVESWLGRHPAVRAAAAVARSDPAGGLRLVAYVVSRGAGASADSLRKYLASHVPEPLVPSAVVFLESMPLTPNGKIDRRALPEPSWESEGAGEPPRSPSERRLAELWSELLEVADISRDANFFALGGHSLLAAQLASRVQETEGLQLPIAEIFDNPRLAPLAARIDDLRDDSTPLPARTLLPSFRTERSDEAPASVQQERFWRSRRQEIHGVAANIPLTLRLSPSVALEPLLESLREVLTRHEILRTTLEEGQGHPVQKIHPPERATDLRRVDLSGLVPVDRHAQLRCLAVETGRRRFDLRRGPLLRFVLLGGGDEGHVLLATLHHVLVDGWSFPILGEEMEHLYASLRAGRPSPLTPPEVQYQEFARWQRHPDREAENERQRAYWREQLRGVEPALPFRSTEAPRRPNHRAGTESFQWSPEQVSALQATASREGVTPFMWLFALYKILLYRETGQDDLAVLTLFAHRPVRETEDMIGNFFTGLPLRTRFAAMESFRQLLWQVRRTVLEAQQNADVLYDRVLEEELGRNPQPGGLPFFRSMFVLQNFPRRAPRAAGSHRLAVERIAIHTGRIRHDLLVFLQPEPDGGLRGRMRYDTGMLDPASAARLRRGFLELFERVARNPGCDLEALLRTPRDELQDAG